MEMTGEIEVVAAANVFESVAVASHPLRTSLSQEMHARKLPQLTRASHLLQFVFVVEPDAMSEVNTYLATLLPTGAAASISGMRYYSGALPPLRICWEIHAEFVTCTFIAEKREGAAPFDLRAFAAIAPAMAAFPGQIIRSTQVCIMPIDALADEAVKGYFADDDLVISEVAHGRARIWSDFRLHPDGFGRLLFQDRDLSGRERAQVVQRLQEVGDYRKMALLGLPVARRQTLEVTQLEQRLARLTQTVADSGTEPEAVLDDLCGLSADLARLMAETRYRMSATRAYGELCLDRIRRLGVSAVAGYGSFDDFTERRLLPAMRTCAAFSERLEDLAQRTSWVDALLRTRVDTALARRNRDLLASMDERAALQLRLQQTVEGLSIVALSYYALGIWGHVRGSLHLALGDRWLQAMDAALVPLIILAVWFWMSHTRRKWAESLKGRADVTPA